MEEKSWKEAVDQPGEIITLRDPNSDAIVKAIILTDEQAEKIEKSHDLDEPIEDIEILNQPKFQKSIGLEEPPKPKELFFKTHRVKSYPALHPKWDIEKGMVVKLKKGIGTVISKGKDGVCVRDTHGKKHNLLWKSVKIPILEDKK